MGLEFSGGEINSLSSFLFFGHNSHYFKYQYYTFFKGNLVARKAIKNKYVAYLI